jgi:hypothetical protein
MVIKTGGARLDFRSWKKTARTASTTQVAGMTEINRKVAPTDHLRLAIRGASGIAWLIVLAVGVHYVWIVYQKYGHMEAGAYSIFWSRREWLMAHLAGGTVTLLLGPFQFLARLRNAYPRIHRWTGRIYLLAVLVGSVGATGLIATSPAGSGLQVAFAATELAWLFTAVMGLIAIRRKRLQVHRRWMVRNYIITFTFVTFRTVALIPGVMGLAAPSVMIPLVLLMSWVVPLLGYGAVLALRQWRAGGISVPSDSAAFLPHTS